jgi:hypothetical protein
VEADNTGQANTGNLIHDNHAHYPYNTAYAATKGSGPYTNFQTGGASASGGTFSYSGNSFYNNSCDAQVGSSILQSATGGTANQAKYSNNTVSGSCTRN